MGNIEVLNYILTTMAHLVSSLMLLSIKLMMKMVHTTPAGRCPDGLVAVENTDGSLQNCKNPHTKREADLSSAQNDNGGGHQWGDWKRRKRERDFCDMDCCGDKM